MRLCRFLFSLCLAIALGGPLAAQQGLNGPSSTGADLQPGDGLTDPQFRFDFPRNAAPGWFDWKDGLAEKGFKFNIDYFLLGQHSSANQGVDNANGGVLKFYGNWQATETGSLTFKLEHRHAFGDVAPQNLGFDGGAWSITGTGFNNKGTQLVNLFWNVRDPDGAWTLQVGQIDATDFVDVYGLVSPWTSFQNLAFNTNPAIYVPDAGIGIAGGARLGSNFYVVGSIVDADADQSAPDLDVFSHGNTFKSIEIGYTSGFDRIYFDNIHIVLWQADGSDNGQRPEDYGAAFSAAWFVDNKWMPFFRAGTSKGTAALYKRSVSAGIGYFGRNTDLAGLGLNWAEATVAPGQQKTVEAFYRFSLSPGFQITPSIQYIHNPLTNPTQSSITIVGLRARIVF